MRFTLILLAAICCAQPAPERSAITGRVVSASTGSPLKKVSVWLERFDRSGALPPATTDAEGRFTLDAVEPGSYVLLARRAAYLDQGYGASTPLVVGPPLALKPGETLRDIVVKLTPQSLVYGNVVDEDGDLVPGAQVEILRRRAVQGNAESQDDGSFVIGNLSPGRYAVRAKLDAGALSDAASVEVAAGAEVRGITLRLRKARVYSVRGRVVPAQIVSLMIDESRSFSTGSDGRFEFTGLRPGAYEIRTNSASSPLVGRAEVVVTDGDLDDLVIRLGEGAAIHGLVKGAARGRVSLGDEAADIKPDGSFELDRLLPAVHALDVSGLPEGSYVKAVNFASRAIDDWKLDLTTGIGGELLILVSPDGAEISGVVPNAPGALVQVWPAGTDSARSVRADAAGAFRVHSLAPGDYRLAAFQDLDDDLARDPQFRAQFENAAAKVKVEEKGRERIELNLISREAIAAEVAKLR
jgi:uncharacterized protein (DUF2141 family)